MHIAMDMHIWPAIRPAIIIPVTVIISVTVITVVAVIAAMTVRTTIGATVRTTTPVIMALFIAATTPIIIIPVTGAGKSRWGCQGQNQASRDGQGTEIAHTHDNLTTQNPTSGLEQ